MPMLTRPFQVRAGTNADHSRKTSESPISLNVWDQQDKFLGMTSPGQRNNKTPRNNKTLSDNALSMKNHHHRGKMEGLRELLAEFDLGT
jgi:hypothetical protein